MKKIITLCLFFIAMIGHSETIDTLITQYKGTQYFLLSNSENRNLIIFLHGGVSNPYFKENRSNIELDFLLEKNQKFVPSSIKAGYDLLLPVTNDTMNWIKDQKGCMDLIYSFLTYSGRQYEEYYIAGFSDGGTASYKLFYKNPNSYSGLIAFNAYPYHGNYASKVDYSNVKDQRVIYFGTKKDKTTPYEFMLTEYCKQKELNPNTFIYLKDGDHSFGHYQTEDFKELFDILNKTTNNTQKRALHGFVKNDELMEFYEFQKSIVRKYSFGEDYYNQNLEQMKLYKNLMK